MKKIILAALSGMAVATFLSQRSRKTSEVPGSAEEDIRDVMRQMREAQLNGDASTLESLFADDYTFTNPFGEVMTKAQVLSDLRSGRIKFGAWDMQDIRLRAYGDSAAVTTGHVKLKGQRDGQDLSGEYRGSWFWVRNHGRWELVAAQATRIGQPAMAGSPQTTMKSTAEL
jgi:uncharacterized protein (TIGR02246 family)